MIMNNYGFIREHLNESKSPKDMKYFAIYCSDGESGPSESDCYIIDIVAARSEKEAVEPFYIKDGPRSHVAYRAKEVSRKEYNKYQKDYADSMEFGSRYGHMDPDFDDYKAAKKNWGREKRLIHVRKARASIASHRRNFYESISPDEARDELQQIASYGYGGSPFKQPRSEEEREAERELFDEYGIQYEDDISDMSDKDAVALYNKIVKMYKSKKKPSRRVIKESVAFPGKNAYGLTPVKGVNWHGTSNITNPDGTPHMDGGNSFIDVYSCWYDNHEGYSVLANMGEDGEYILFKSHFKSSEDANEFASKLLKSVTTQYDTPEKVAVKFKMELSHDGQVII